MGGADGRGFVIQRLGGDNRNNMLTILYRRDYLVSVAKPPGLLVHRTGLDAGETRLRCSCCATRSADRSGRCIG